MNEFLSVEGSIGKMSVGFAILSEKMERTGRNMTLLTEALRRFDERARLAQGLPPAHYAPFPKFGLRVRP